ncbi:hypothetical protein [Stenotrophomonas sp. MH181796]|uniref:hypothetical protein n=1 Tax=Stenotrophomonas sp. MH181796 TaxID=2339228 RepID=UPI00129CD1E1|nr:hypothetical protein [Stenotrophomonas sp. MH181796]
MLKAIGGAVVYGFALYGLNTFMEKVKVMQRVKRPLDLGDPGQVAGQEDVPVA